MGADITLVRQNNRGTVRRAIQNSQESIAKLAERYDLNAKTVNLLRNRRIFRKIPLILDFVVYNIVLYCLLGKNVK
ncbi:hypothetical protein BIY23_01235 [Wolbachia pipientis]|uniref:Uncharacterized protein n=1 Tax=Wolbachia pipientis TaxID=955 RepID=A0A1E7QKX0_WOLPI|nr:hypothetical protein [Wolbachia pipientis]OEY87093.1 hypothetical protein BIY23_01235 [Wolbachia pipientis]